MGIVDIVVLHDLYREAVKQEKEYNWGFKFKMDEGTFETAIEFQESSSYRPIAFHPPEAKNWDDAQDILCPDILDFWNRIVIEYEEETGKPKKGAHYAKKGHGHPGDLASIRDSRRDSLYLLGGFRVLKIWESEYNDGSWRKKMWRFFCDCFCNRISPKFPLQA